MTTMIPRWIATITYRTEAGPLTVEHDFVELRELRRTSSSAVPTGTRSSTSRSRLLGRPVPISPSNGRWKNEKPAPQPEAATAATSSSRASARCGSPEMQVERSAGRTRPTEAQNDLHLYRSVGLACGVGEYARIFSVILDGIFSAIIWISIHTLKNTILVSGPKGARQKNGPQDRLYRVIAIKRYLLQCRYKLLVILDKAADVLQRLELKIGNCRGGLNQTLMHLTPHLGLSRNKLALNFIELLFR
jgi:hypothetical protein